MVAGEGIVQFMLIEERGILPAVPPAPTEMLATMSIAPLLFHIPE
jgi:hypothetical protein